MAWARATLHNTNMTTEGARHTQLLHDLRTPLSVVKGSIEILLGHWDHMEESRRGDLLARALVNVDDLATVIEHTVTPSGRKAGVPGENGRAPRAGRPVLSGVAVARGTDGFKAAVTLDAGGRGLEGRSGGRGGRDSERRAVALAVLNALEGRLGGVPELEDLEMIEMGGDRVATVLVRWRGRLLIGSALVHYDDYDALSRATLDAINRPLAHMQTT